MEGKDDGTFDLIGMIDALKRPNAIPNSSNKEKADILDKAYSAIFLSLDDKALREFLRKTSTAAMWLKLEKFHMTKSLANRLYMKQRLYSFKMHEKRSISDQIDIFNKILDDFTNIDVKLEDEDKALILLNALPMSNEYFNDVMLYGRNQTIILEKVQSKVKAKEL